MFSPCLNPLVTPRTGYCFPPILSTTDGHGTWCRYWNVVDRTRSCSEQRSQRPNIPLTVPQFLSGTCPIMPLCLPQDLRGTRSDSNMRCGAEAEMQRSPKPVGLAGQLVYSTVVAKLTRKESGAKARETAVRVMSFFVLLCLKITKLPPIT